MKKENKKKKKNIFISLLSKKERATPKNLLGNTWEIKRDILFKNSRDKTPTRLKKKRLKKEKFSVYIQSKPLILN